MSIELGYLYGDDYDYYMEDTDSVLDTPIGRYPFFFPRPPPPPPAPTYNPNTNRGSMEDVIEELELYFETMIDPESPLQEN